MAGSNKKVYVCEKCDEIIIFEGRRYRYMRVTVFTSTYNRAKVIYRVYESLVNQIYRDFVWLIIDDGSEDNTKEIIEKFKEEANFPIIYYYQKNAGKHVAINKAVEMTETELFVIADSDDSFLPDALEVLVQTWDGIQDKENYKGVTCRCIDSKTLQPLSKTIEGDFLDGRDIDFEMKKKIRGELWGILATKALKEFPFPEPEEALHFFPEAVIWHRMSKKYKVRMINDSLRVYYRGEEKKQRFRENIYLWAHYINELDEYLFYKPEQFLKAYIGLSRDGILCGKSWKTIIKIPNKKYKRFIVALFYPIGKYLSNKK